MNESLIDRLVICHCRMANAVIAAQKDDIWVCEQDEPTIQVGSGIEKLALSIGAEIKVEPYDCAERPIKESFIYKGITFFQIGSESVETEAHDA